MCFTSNSVRNNIKAERPAKMMRVSVLTHAIQGGQFTGLGPLGPQTDMASEQRRKLIKLAHPWTTSSSPIPLVGLILEF